MTELSERSAAPPPLPRARCAYCHGSAGDDHLGDEKSAPTRDGWGRYSLGNLTGLIGPYWRLIVFSVAGAAL